MKTYHLVTFLLIIPLLSSCDFWEKVEKKAAVLNQYETTALLLAKENRELHIEIDKLNFEKQNLKSQIEFLEMKLKSKRSKKRKPKTRVPASVDFHTYRWSPDELLAMAQVYFENKNYKKASDYFYTYTVQYPKHEKLSDEVLFQAGVSAYESKNRQYYQRAITHLGALVEKYPNSSFYRGGKLWLALAKEKIGDKKFFYKTVEEFRKNYRNTQEWEILSAHYETITAKYSKR